MMQSPAQIMFPLIDKHAERMWAGIISSYTCFNEDYVIAWGRKYNLHLKPIALLVEELAVSDNVTPDRLVYFYETLINDLHDDTCKCIQIYDHDTLHYQLKHLTQYTPSKGYSKTIDQHLEVSQLQS